MVPVLLAVMTSVGGISKGDSKLVVLGMAEVGPSLKAEVTGTIEVIRATPVMLEVAVEREVTVMLLQVELDDSLFTTTDS